MNLTALLQTYSLEEIIELNELTNEEVLEYLIEHGILNIPQPTPVDFNE